MIIPAPRPPCAGAGRRGAGAAVAGRLPAQAWRLRLGFAGAGPGQVALFMNGLRQPARLERGGWLTATIDPPTGCAVVLGLAWPDGAPDGLRLAMLEARP